MVHTQARDRKIVASSCEAPQFVSREYRLAEAEAEILKVCSPNV